VELERDGVYEPSTLESRTLRVTLVTDREKGNTQVTLVTSPTASFGR